MANTHRSEIKLKLAGKAWKMRPSFDAIAEVEDATGLGLAAMVQRFARSEFGVREVAAIVTAGIRAVHGDDGPDAEAVHEAVVGKHFAALSAAAAALLVAAVGGGSSRSGETPAKKAGAPGETA